MELNIILYGIGFLLLLLIGGMIINGIFITTRGESETRPDGSVRDTNDMIFYPFYKFLTAEALPPEKVYYKGQDLYRLYKRLIKALPLPACDSMGEDYIYFEKERNGTGPHEDPQIQDGFLDLRAAVKLWSEYSRDLLDEMDVKAEYSHARIMFYKEYRRYRFSKYIRKPLLECIKCMASFWGTIIWWPTVICLFGFHWQQLPLWIAYCFSLSYVNTYLFYKAR